MDAKFRQQLLAAGHNHVAINFLKGAGLVLAIAVMMLVLKSL